MDIPNTKEQTIDANKDLFFSSRDFKKKLFERINGISSAFNVPYPINPKLRYEYPPINRITLENIINALISCPKFYTQTLHLMNKMNMPCPLVSFIRKPGKSLFNQPEEQQLLNNNFLEKSTIDCDSESEIESEIELEQTMTDKHLNIQTYVESTKTKKLKVKSFLKSKNIVANHFETDKMDLTEVFEAAWDSNKKSVNRNLGSTASNVYDREIIPAEAEGFAKIIPINKKIEDFQPMNEKVIEIDNQEGNFISKEKLESNRLKIADLKELPVYKKYERGETNSRIYLKNLAKTVEESDLKFIYGRYIDWNNESHVNSFDIRLMKEGRMKGQAFITFPNEDIASKALNDTNGYLLKEKPIIISFARSAKPK